MSTKKKTNLSSKLWKKLENLNLAASSVGFLKCFRFKPKTRLPTIENESALGRNHFKDTHEIKLCYPKSRSVSGNIFSINSIN